MRNGHGIFTTTDFSDYIDFYFDNGLRRITQIICDFCEKQETTDCSNYRS